MPPAGTSSRLLLARPARPWHITSLRTPTYSSTSPLFLRARTFASDPSDSTNQPQSPAATPSSTPGTAAEPEKKLRSPLDEILQPKPNKNLAMQHLLSSLRSREKANPAERTLGLGKWAPSGSSGRDQKKPDSVASRAFGSREFMDSMLHPQPDHHITLHILANKNNTVATLTTPEGKVLTKASAGNLKLKKAARGTSDAGYQTVAYLTEKALALPEKKGNEKAKVYHTVDVRREVMENGVHLKFKGFGPGRDQAFRAVLAAGWKVVRLSDSTAVRFAGCRPRKKRRL
ncbi:hypothetical protein PhCBS80983_g03760 [Powellomyces hirtus]|uniref:Ribosomal protein S11 n=1 Tax=Powellomyces hirtus TaxID=109895 RepID=A0A507E1I0_9FUNG|nr:hypothetical protein PhCBS80983_g03760 [Powellomyces hirtus]